jgi:PucR-like helix-turn-helix protein
MRARPEVAWHRLLAVLLERRAELTDQISRRMCQRLPVYQELDAARLRRDVGLAMVTTARLARDTPPKLSAEQTLVLEQVGAAQALVGIPVDQMLLAWRIGADLLVERGIAEAERLELGAPTVLEFVRGTLAAADVGMATTARAHRATELERDREAQDRRASFVRALLFGTGEPAQLRARAKSYGLDPALRYRAVRARPADQQPWPELERAVGLGSSDPPERGLSVRIDADLAGFIQETPGTVGDAAPGRAGVGPAVALERLAESFRLATRALHTLRAFDLTGTSDLATLGLRAAVVADTDVGAALRSRYLEPLARTGSADEIIATLRAYLAAGAHVDTAARRLHIHANTLRYRLARFEELADAHLRDPLVAFEVWWAIESTVL